MHVIIGASGLIGNRILRHCREVGLPCLGTYFRHALPQADDVVRFDLRKDSVSDLLGNVGKPDGKLVVFLCSANASIDSCKSDPEDSRELNVLATKRVLQEVAQVGGKSVFFSSEAVFDGEKGLYSEADLPSPVTEYGRQKVEVERYIQESIKDCLIFRISRAVSTEFGAPGIFTDFYDKMSRKKEVVCLKGQSFCLTETGDIARASVMAVERGMKGMYHLASANYVTRYELAKMFAGKVMGGYEAIFERPYEELSFLDQRHVHSGLDASRLNKKLPLAYKTTEQMLEAYVASMEAAMKRNGE